MPAFFIIYTACWAIATLCALVTLCLRYKEVDFLSKSYWKYLLTPWKMMTFLLAGTGIVLIAPYTGDVTWDYYDAAMMAILTFMTAPWSIGTLYKTMIRQRALWQAYIAICLWLFSASWCYDLYLLVRDGYYPITWFSNIFASSILYISAGLLWNLEYQPQRGVIFGFMEKDWPLVHAQSSFKKVLLFALPFMLIAGVAILSFVV